MTDIMIVFEKCTIFFTLQSLGVQCPEVRTEKSLPVKPDTIVLFEFHARTKPRKSIVSLISAAQIKRKILISRFRYVTIIIALYRSPRSKKPLGMFYTVCNVYVSRFKKSMNVELPVI